MPRKAKIDKFEKMYFWKKNRFENRRRLPQKIRNDNAKCLHYNVDVAIRWLDGTWRIYENTSPILSFIGPEPIAYWRRSISSYQASFDFGETK